ncbi:hypothetical protein [Roseibium sp.]|uniref:hypothetical protein n=1 Tax=Roseibium sp. TaxID=1936156 RepID=UPI00260A923C|nr:hypothetical protein [Roseibium sp.]
MSDDLMKRLLDATLSAVADVSSQLSENQRAALAVYCYRRSHFRQLGLSLAAQCSRQSLVTEAGHAGELIHAQANREDTSSDRQSGNRAHGGRAPVSLYTV